MKKQNYRGRSPQERGLRTPPTTIYFKIPLVVGHYHQECAKKGRVISNSALAVGKLNIDLLQSIPISSSSFRRQWNNKNWFSGPIQHRTGNTAQKSMG